ESGDLGITTTQYGILFVLKHRPGIDQISLAKLLGLDRSTTGMVVTRLATDGLIGRGVGAPDTRRRSRRLTAEGRKTLTRLSLPAERAQAHLLSPLAPAERAQFLDMLDKVMRTFNGSTRVPLSGEE